MKKEIINWNNIDIVPNYSHLKRYNQFVAIAGVNTLAVIIFPVIFTYNDIGHYLWWFLPFPIVILGVSLIFLIQTMFSLRCCNCGMITRNVVRDEPDITLIFYCDNCGTYNDALVSRQGGG